MSCFILAVFGAVCGVIGSIILFPLLLVTIEQLLKNKKS